MDSSVRMTSSAVTKKLRDVLQAYYLPTIILSEICIKVTECGVASLASVLFCW